MFNLEILNLEFVSNFDIRISNLNPHIVEVSLHVNITGLEKHLA